MCDTITGVGARRTFFETPSAQSRPCLPLLQSTRGQMRYPGRYSIIANISASTAFQEAVVEGIYPTQPVEKSWVIPYKLKAFITTW